jgi:hypothetical protein
MILLIIEILLLTMYLNVGKGDDKGGGRNGKQSKKLRNEKRVSCVVQVLEGAKR